MTNPIRAYYSIPIPAIKAYWGRGQPLPWTAPPLLDLPGRGATLVDALFVTTAGYNGYELPHHHEFFRLIFLDGQATYLHEDGLQEPVIMLQARLRHPLQFDPTTVIGPSNIIYLKR